ncbi:Serine/threonine-protein kinase N2 [Liparis tanakae]|uniref:Serine/threonine-protein kinase N2 n=1 Tax=Liparis tanakae TaxID=230148 RepID=A0A4Z2HA91_9TELE|nr:Serine/threonine-protein kinase N2 [Liparis tanakae]
MCSLVSVAPVSGQSSGAPVPSPRTPQAPWRRPSVDTSSPISSSRDVSLRIKLEGNTTTEDKNQGDCSPWRLLFCVTCAKGKRRELHRWEAAAFLRSTSFSTSLLFLSYPSPALSSENRRGWSGCSVPSTPRYSSFTCRHRTSKPKGNVFASPTTPVPDATPLVLRVTLGATGLGGELAQPAGDGEALLQQQAVEGGAAEGLQVHLLLVVPELLRGFCTDGEEEEEGGSCDPRPRPRRHVTHDRAATWKAVKKAGGVQDRVSSSSSRLKAPQSKSLLVVLREAARVHGEEHHVAQEETGGGVQNARHTGTPLFFVGFALVSLPAAGIDLLQKNPEKRLGGGEEDAQEIKRHQFFKKDVSNFDEEFTRLQPVLTPPRTPCALTEEQQEIFAHFDFSSLS